VYDIKFVFLFNFLSHYSLQIAIFKTYSSYSHFWVSPTNPHHGIRLANLIACEEKNKTNKMQKLILD